MPQTTIHNGPFAEHYRADTQPNGDVYLTVTGDMDGDASVAVIPRELRPWLAAVLMPPGPPGTLSGRLDMLATLPTLATPDALRGLAAQARRLERFAERLAETQAPNVVPFRRSDRGIGGAGAVS